MARGGFFVFSACLLGFFIISVQGIFNNTGVKHNKVVVCYVASWAMWRPEQGKFKIENLQPNHCTHLIYAFAGLNATTSMIRVHDSYLDLEIEQKGYYRKITELRTQYPHLKITLAIGGWNEGSENYSALAASPEKRKIFIRSVLDFMKMYNFDGLDLDWEFPAARGGKPEDKNNFSQLVKELKAAFESQRLLLTAAISADISKINAGYDIPEISKYLDYIHVMAYDYHGSWDEKVLPTAPLRCNDSLCVVTSIDHLFKLGAPAEKLVLGLPMYGRTYVLVTKPANGSAVNPIGAPASPNGFQGIYTKTAGFLGYNEICKLLVETPEDWRTGWYEDGNSAWAMSGDKVVVYDNPKSLITKTKYAKKNKLAGVMIWSVDTDDFHGVCSTLHHGFLNYDLTDYPLMKSINLALSEETEDVPDDNNTTRLASSSDLAQLSVAVILITLIIHRV